MGVAEWVTRCGLAPGGHAQVGSGRGPQERGWEPQSVLEHSWPVRDGAFPPGTGARRGSWPSRDTGPGGSAWIPAEGSGSSLRRWPCVWRLGSAASWAGWRLRWRALSPAAGGWGAGPGWRPGERRPHRGGGVGLQGRAPCWPLLGFLQPSGAGARRCWPHRDDRAARSPDGPPEGAKKDGTRRSMISGRRQAYSTGGGPSKRPGPTRLVARAG